MSSKELIDKLNTKAREMLKEGKSHEEVSDFLRHEICDAMIKDLVDPCIDCQEFDCYGCEYKKGEN